LRLFTYVEAMALVAPTFDEMVDGIRRGVAIAVREAHARGLPVFEADDTTIYAIYPDGRRVAIERLPEASKQSRPKSK
jgi:hypothetical protein